MKSYIFVALAAVAVLMVACSEKYAKAENSADAAREFIKAFLQGDHEKAHFYLLKDSTNEMMFQTQKAAYSQMSDSMKRARKDASIIVINMEQINDSSSNFRYYQSANPSDTTQLRVVRVNNEWLVDLKSVIKL